MRLAIFKRFSSLPAAAGATPSPVVAETAVGIPSPQNPRAYTAESDLNRRAYIAQSAATVGGKVATFKPIA